MGKQILIVLGSPRRKGNSAALASALAGGAEARGAATETVFLNGLDIRPCQACDACQKPDARGCVLRDDMIPLYTRVQAADAVVLASPIYLFQVSAQTKLFIDRLHACVNAKTLLVGKRFALLLSYADVDAFVSGAVNAIRSFQDFCRYAGAANAGMVYGRAHAPGEIQHNHALMEQARQLGEALASP